MLLSNVLLLTLLASVSKAVPHGSPRIVNGVPATNDEFPWIVSFKVYCESDNYVPFDLGHFCGGTLIDTNGTAIVVTASHCLDDIDATVSGYESYYESNYVGGFDCSLVVDIGRTKVKGDLAETYQRVEILEYYLHEDYDPSTTANDVAVASLTDPIDSSLAPNAVAATWDVDTQLVNNDFLRVIGYGTNESGGDLSPTLEYADMEYVDATTCNQYQNLYWYVNQSLGIGWEQYNWSNPDFSPLSGAGYTYDYILDGMICGWNINKDSCQGDSGGPLIDGASSSSNLVGVVSWGFFCAHGIPGVYADVNYYRDWIRGGSACLHCSITNSSSCWSECVMWSGFGDNFGHTPTTTEESFGCTIHVSNMLVVFIGIALAYIM